MKKGIRNMAKTINLSSLKTCERPQKVQKLVSAEVMEPCPKTGHETTSFSTPRPVTINVCTRKDMQRTCPPKLCACPQETEISETSGRSFMRWVTFILRSSAAVGLVYWTTAEGVWGDNNQTEDLYYRITTTVAPTLLDEPDIDNV